jgi:hypothetical protein
VITRVSHEQASDGPGSWGQYCATSRREGAAPSSATHTLGLDDLRGGTIGTCPVLGAALPVRGGRLDHGPGRARAPTEVGISAYPFGPREPRRRPQSHVRLKPAGCGLVTYRLG